MFNDEQSIMIKYFLNFILVAACLALFCPLAGWAETGQLNENELKAAYLYNFAKYVDWPTAALPRENAPLVMCIIGKSPVNEVIESLAGKTIKNRRLVVRQFSRVEDLRECNILFVNTSVKTSLTQILASVTSRPILTVSDSKGFAAAGGVIEFVPVGDKIRFEINNRAAQHVNIRISSHLLRLATTVIE
jgi:hypothetical protein